MASRYERIQAKRRRNLERLSIPSQFFHLIHFAIKRSTMQFENGCLITSIDVDVGSKLVGEMNKGKNDVNVHGYLTESRIGEIEENAIPLLIEFYNNLEIPVTFAIRGQLTETKSDILERLLRSSIKHDIGGHGYYHRTFNTISIREAQNELELLSVGMKKFGINPKSFVFPKNQVAHLSLLEKFGYECYRGEGGLGKDEMCVKKRGGLYDVRPGFHLGVTYNPVFLNKMIDLLTKNKVSLHLWFHPRDIFETRGRSMSRNIDRVLLPIYKYAKKKEKQGKLNFETMHSITEKIKLTYSQGH